MMSGDRIWKWFALFALLLLFLGLNFGVLAAHSYTAPGLWKDTLGFIKLRPLHVTTVVFWILVGSTAALYFAISELGLKFSKKLAMLQLICWIVATAGILYSYFRGTFGGREYWEYPPAWSLPVLAAWLIMVVQYFNAIREADRHPVYIWMWGTGLSFFVFIFLENYLWTFDSFRADFIRDTTVQWKVNGSLVGCWNQIIYGTSIYLMERISGEEGPARSRLAISMYFLGLFNLMFNWSHHIYTLPTAMYIRYVGYFVSMTEWIIFLKIVWNFKTSLKASRRHLHLLSYRFLMAADYWVFVNLFMALVMSIPVINVYTHGTHVTVAHAMGTTIGINTMILLGVLAYAIERKAVSVKQRKWLNGSWLTVQFSLLVFWVSLIIAGILKTKWQLEEPGILHAEIMERSLPLFRLFSYSGSVMLFAFSIIIFIYIRNLLGRADMGMQAKIR